MSKMKLTLNNYEEDNFAGKFYLLESGNMYCVYLKDSHAVLISQPTLDMALKCFSDLLHKYGTYTKFIKELKTCDYPVTKISPAILKKRQASYKKEGDKYINEVNNIVNTFNNYTKELLKEKTKVKPLKVKKKLFKKRA